MGATRNANRGSWFETDNLVDKDPPYGDFTDSAEEWGNPIISGDDGDFDFEDLEKLVEEEIRLMRRKRILQFLAVLSLIFAILRVISVFRSSKK